jgi:hypothetical protein
MIRSATKEWRLPLLFFFPSSFSSFFYSQAFLIFRIWDFGRFWTFFVIFVIFSDFCRFFVNFEKISWLFVIFVIFLWFFVIFLWFSWFFVIFSRFLCFFLIFSQQNVRAGGPRCVFSIHFCCLVRIWCHHLGTKNNW